MAEKRIRVWVQEFKDRATLQLQWIDPATGRRRTKSAGTADEAEAEAQRVDLEADLNGGRYREASRMSWECFRELFEAEYLPGLRPDTQAVYRNVFRLFEEICRPQTLRSITGRTISTFLAGLRKQPGRGAAGKDGMQPSSIKVRLQFLQTALRWAAEQKLIPEMPPFPEVKVPKHKPQPVALEAFERLVEKTGDAELRAFVLCGWLAGLRLNEARCLEWEQTTEAPWVDFTRSRIWLPAGFVKAVEDQWVPLDPVLRAALEVLPRQGRRVFPWVNWKGKPLSREGTAYRVIRLAKRAGVRLTMRSLRRGFGCRYAGKVSAQVLQKLMRHSSIQTTMSYYANVDVAAEEAVLGPCNGKRNTPASEHTPHTE